MLKTARTVLIASLASSAMITAPAMASDLEVGNISDRDIDAVKRRVKSLNLWGYGIGPASSSGLNSDKMMYSVNITNHRDASLQGEIRWGARGAFAEDGKAGFSSLSLGGAYFFSKSSISPLIGGEFGFAGAYGDDVDPVAGFMVGGLLGVRFFRTSDTQLDLTGRCDFLLKETEEEKQPSVCSLNLSVLVQ